MIFQLNEYFWVQTHERLRNYRYNFVKNSESKGVDLDALLSASTPREWMRSAADIQYTIEQHKEDYLVCTEAPRRIIEQTQKESKARSKGRSMGL